MTNPRYRRITPNRPLAQHAKRDRMAWSRKLPYALCGILLGLTVALYGFGWIRIWFNF